ncbi:DUF6111 family protein [Roseibium sp. RKSG952]|uniref:DUF6111 family protein n=1 Tax=Roseibium sp. RKSG952 TaxID=2529384 RepID=UPI0012BBA170|nr:DUF6111 family protein [Roseibium sp. RKSG952]MTH98414.1 hypothetical protein [Roseibium sp. RKSG952]
MIRVVLSHLLVFALPFIGYAIWLWANKKAQTRENWRSGPMPWLALTGLVLVLVSLGVFANFKRAPDGTEYRPSQMQDGVFVPGGYE